MKKKILSTILVSTLVCSMGTSAFAASSNRVTSTPTVAKKQELGSIAPYLVIDLKDDLDVNSTFYVELKNAEWIDTEITVSNTTSAATFITDIVDKNTLAVTLTEVTAEDGSTLTKLEADSVIRIKLNTKVGNATATVRIDSAGTTISSTTDNIKFAIINENGADISTDDEIPTFTIESDCIINPIYIEEAYEGAFVSETNRNGDVEFVIRIEDGDVEFLTAKNIKVEGTKGFSGVSGDVDIDDDELIITVDGTDLDGLEKGGFKISGITLDPLEDDISGTVTLDISGDAFKSASLKVAKFVDESLIVSIKSTEKNSKYITAGTEQIYKIDIEEATKETLLDGRKLTFSLENGYFADANTIDAKSALAFLDKKLNLPTELELDSVELEDTYIKAFTTVVSSDEDDIEEFSFKFPVTADLNNLVEHMFKITEEGATEDDDKDVDKDSSLTFDVNNSSSSKSSNKSSSNESSKDDKIDPVVMTISGRAIDGEVEATVDDVICPVVVKLEEKTFKSGLKDQEGTDIIIEEQIAGALQKGRIQIQFDDVDGLSFSEPPTVKSSGDIKLGKGELIRNGNDIAGFAFSVIKQSKEPSTITISDVVITADRTVPEGYFGLLFGGSALTDEPVSSEKYAKIQDINITDSNKEIENLQSQIDKLQQDITQQVGEPLTVAFTVGSTNYTVNGQQKMMDAAPYLSANGRTMIPVRYVADALGIPPTDISNNNGYITIFTNEGVIQFKIGSATMLAGGSVLMDEKATLKEGRTYIPVAFAAKALGVNVTYDSSTKTITFKNKSAMKASEQPTIQSPTQSQSTQQSTSQSMDILDILQ